MPNDLSDDPKPAKREHFPETQLSWIQAQFDEGEQGRQSLAEHVMRVYYHPLQVYFKGLRGQKSSDAEDVVGGYFADRLARDDFMEKWRESGLRLRRWLMNGLHFYLKERYRADNRAKPRGESALIDLAGEEPDYAAEFDEEFARAIVAEALSRTKESCESTGLETHFQVFHRHHIEDVAYNDFVHEFGITRVRASVMSRTVRDRFRQCLQQLLVEDGADADEVGSEIRHLMEILS